MPTPRRLPSPCPCYGTPIRLCDTAPSTCSTPCRARTSRKTSRRSGINGGPPTRPRSTPPSRPGSDGGAGFLATDRGALRTLVFSVSSYSNVEHRTVSGIEEPSQSHIHATSEPPQSHLQPLFQMILTS